MKSWAHVAGRWAARAGLSRAGWVGVCLFTATLCSGLAVTWFGERPARPPAAAPPGSRGDEVPDQPEPPSFMDPELRRDIAAYLELTAAGPASPSRPAAQPIPAAGNPAVADAIRLLLLAAANPHGQLVEREAGNGYSLAVGTTTLCQPSDGPRTAARWRMIVTALHAMGLIELARAFQVGPATFPYDFTVWRLTEDGYLRAEALARKP